MRIDSLRLSFLLLAALTASATLPACGDTKAESLGETCHANSDCDIDLICELGECAVKCAEDRDCPVGSRCLSSVNGNGCESAAAAACSGACGDGTVCGPDGQCRASCSATIPCLADQVCGSSLCYGTSPTHDTAGTGGAGGAGGAGGSGVAGTNAAGGMTGVSGSAGSGGSAGQTMVTTETVLYQSGTRLRAIVDRDPVTHDAASFVAWQDTKLGFACVFLEGSDGEPRCFPSEGAEVQYLDANCQQPVAVVTSTCTPPTYALKVVGAIQCATDQVRVAAYQVGTKMPSPTALYSLDGGSCESAELLFKDPFDTYAIAAPADESTFVHASVVTEPRGSSINAQVYVGDDQSRLVFGFVDVAHDWDCAPGGSLFQSGDVPYCLPVAVAGDTGLFSDPGCMSHVMSVNPSTCSASVGELTSADPCAITPSYVALGPAPTTLYEASPTCDVTPPFTGVGYLTAGAPIDLHSLPSTPTQQQGTGRLQREVTTVDGTHILSMTTERTYNDTLQGTSCAPIVLKDGKVVCLPFPATSIGAIAGYADSVCSQPLVMSSKAPGCAAAPPSIMVVKDETDCGPDLLGLTYPHIYASGGQFVGTTGFTFDGTDCVPVSNLPTPLYIVGQELDPETAFALMERVIE